jgi:hypothetical protein
MMKNRETLPLGGRDCRDSVATKVPRPVALLRSIIEKPRNTG